jgi:hypothetical protein
MCPRGDRASQTFTFIAVGEHDGVDGSNIRHSTITSVTVPVMVELWGPIPTPPRSSPVG